MIATEHSTSLAKVVSERREELGLSKSELCKRAQITRSTLHEIENGTRRSLMPATYEALDGALGWLPGTLKRLSTTAPPRPTQLPRPPIVPDIHEQMANLRIIFDAQAAAADINRALLAMFEELEERVRALEGHLPLPDRRPSAGSKVLMG